MLHEFCRAAQDVTAVAGLTAAGPVPPRGRPLSLNEVTSKLGTATRAGAAEHSAICHFRDFSLKIREFFAGNRECSRRQMQNSGIDLLWAISPTESLLSRRKLCARILLGRVLIKAAADCVRFSPNSGAEADMTRGPLRASSRTCCGPLPRRRANGIYKILRLTKSIRA